MTRDWIATALLLVSALAYIAMDTAIGWLIPATVIGGAVIAVTLFAARRQQSSLTPDIFARRGMSSDVINVSRIRVAGAGGLGLMFVAGVVALQYPISASVLVVGLVGGALLGFALIIYRR